VVGLDSLLTGLSALLPILVACDARESVRYPIPPDELDELEGNVGVDALERDDVDRRLLQQRERLLVLPPLGPERLLPLVVRLNAVALADVHGGLRAQALGCTFERSHAPVLRRVVEDGEA